MEKSIKRKLDVSGYGQHDTKYFIIFGQHYIYKVLIIPNFSFLIPKPNKPEP